jgi:hypothetical protein
MQSDLLLPASIVLRAEGHFGFDRVVESEKSGGLFKHGVDLSDTDSMIDDAEKAHVRCCIDKLPGYVLNSGIEIGKGDCWDDSVEILRFAHGQIQTRETRLQILEVMFLSSFVPIDCTGEAVLSNSREMLLGVTNREIYIVKIPYLACSEQAEDRKAM